MFEVMQARRVLIVDDERVITDTLVTIFSQRGYEAKGAYSAEQALAALEAWHADLVIADVWLPEMNGIDLAIRIKSEWPDCFISLFSGQAATNDLLIAACRDGHALEILAKPVHPDTLLGIATQLFREPSLPP